MSGIVRLSLAGLEGNIQAFLNRPSLDLPPNTRGEPANLVDYRTALRVISGGIESARHDYRFDQSPPFSRLTEQARREALDQVEKAAASLLALDGIEITRAVLDAMDRQLDIAMRAAWVLWNGGQEFHSEAVEAFDVVGGIAVILQQWDKAILAFRKAENHPAFVGCHFERGMQKFREGKWQAARIDFQTVVAMWRGNEKFADMYRRAVGWRNVCQFRLA